MALPPFTAAMPNSDTFDINNNPRPESWFPQILCVAYLPIAVENRG